MRRLDESVAASRKALELDPLSPYLQWRLAYRYRLMRQLDRAIEQCRNTLEIDHHYYFAHWSIGIIYVQTGRFEEGIRAFETAAQLSGNSPQALGSLGYAYAHAGRISDARKLLAELQELAQKAYVPPVSTGLIHLALGEIDRSFDWLEKAVDERDGAIFTLSAEPICDLLRPHARFQALLRKMNLAP